MHIVYFGRYVHLVKRTKITIDQDFYPSRTGSNPLSWLCEAPERKQLLRLGLGHFLDSGRGWCLFLFLGSGTYDSKMLGAFLAIFDSQFGYLYIRVDPRVFRLKMTFHVTKNPHPGWGGPDPMGVGGNSLYFHSKKSPTGPTEGTPKPEYLRI